jgi:hypothetical protein
MGPVLSWQPAKKESRTTDTDLTNLGIFQPPGVRFRNNGQIGRQLADWWILRRQIVTFRG